MPVGNALIAALLEVVYIVLNFYVWALIVGAVVSWLSAFGVINPYNRFVQLVNDFLSRIAEPLLAPIRRRLPRAGAFDFSPLVLILILFFLQSFIRRLLVGF